MKSAYELSESQVATPLAVVSLLWKLAHQSREVFNNVIDFGAGDGRFAKGGRFKTYVGIEIDVIRSVSAKLPRNGHIISGCAFAHEGSDYDACVGNPPYVRHHDIESLWKKKTLERIEVDLGIRLNGKCNLYIYFMCLGLLKTRADGLLSFVIPFEWVSRPSAAPVRQYIKEQRWEVRVFRFTQRIFSGVLTTASITIIDKAKRNGIWSYFDIDEDHAIRRRQGFVDSAEGMLKYDHRGSIWAMRGISPGSQRVFCLTEGERIHHGLKRTDVLPCVTSLRDVPRHLEQLTKTSFEKHFVRSGARCWLLKSHRRHCTQRVRLYLGAIPNADHDNYTCNTREPWFRFKLHPVPKILIGSGFVGSGPKVLINCVGAHAIGSVTGIHAEANIATRSVRKELLAIKFDSIVVPHAKTLKKVEVRQLNSALNSLSKKALKNANRSS